MYLVGCQTTTQHLQLNRVKRIGKVLFIVEGGSTEPYILRRLFTQVFDYEVHAILRAKPYHRYNSQTNPESQVYVVNAEESNLKFIARDNQFLNSLFEILITDYTFDIENAAIYYLFDRDPLSNTDPNFIRDLLLQLRHAREINEDYGRQGLLLLSYPSIESFTAANFITDCFSINNDNTIVTGNHLKTYLHQEGINHQDLSDMSLVHAVAEMLAGMLKMNIYDFDIDNLGNTNRNIFDWQEDNYRSNGSFRLLSTLSMAFLDLGLISERELPSVWR